MFFFGRHMKWATTQYRPTILSFLCYFVRVDLIHAPTVIHVHDPSFSRLSSPIMRLSGPSPCPLPKRARAFREGSLFQCFCLTQERTPVNPIFDVCFFRMPHEVCDHTVSPLRYYCFLWCFVRVDLIHAPTVIHVHEPSFSRPS